MKIVTYPNPILTKPNQEVKFPLDQKTQNLIQAMWQKVDGLGIGLAAPQVGENLRICIIHMSKGGKKHLNKLKSFVMINPEIVFYSQTENLMVEGCLSFPDQYYEIWRPAGIKVRYQDEKGRFRELPTSGLLARVIQHEVDHLNGKLFINLGGRLLPPDELDEDAIVE